MKRICTAAKLRKLRFHDIRHSFASQLVMNGQPMKSVQELLGHSTMAMTEVYSHLSPNVNVDAVGSLLQPPDAAEEKRQVGHGLGTVSPLEPPAAPIAHRRLLGKSLRGKKNPGDGGGRGPVALAGFKPVVGR